MEKSLTPCFVRVLLTVAFLAVRKRGKGAVCGGGC